MQYSTQFVGFKYYKLCTGSLKTDSVRPDIIFELFISGGQLPFSQTLCMRRAYRKRKANVHIKQQNTASP